MKTEYSLCESQHAGYPSTWHIRKLSEAGKKFGGGIDTPTLCGRDMKGWDVQAELEGKFGHLDMPHTCTKCREAYKQLK